MAMDCDVCNNLLLDLLYGELDEVRAAAVRRHLEGCAACRAGHERLSRGHALAQKYVPIEAPAPSEALLTALRASIERASVPPVEANHSPVVALATVEQHPLRIPRWLRQAGEVAMRRQVAMAAVFLLMVGVGLRFYQYQPPPRTPDADVSPAPEVIPAQEVRGEAPPSPATPAAAIAPHRAAASPPRAALPMGTGSDHHAASAHAAPSLVSPPVVRSDSVANRGLAQGSAQGLVDVGRAGSSLQAQPAPTTVLQAPSSGRVAGVDRDLQRALPAPPPGSPLENSTGDAAHVASSPWRTALTQASDLSAHHQNDQAVAAYRHALDIAPDAESRREIATEFVPFLRITGHAAEAQQVSGYLANAPNDTTGLGNALSQGSVPHAASSVPHPSAMRPARTRTPMPVGMDSNSQAGF